MFKEEEFKRPYPPPKKIHLQYILQQAHFQRKQL